MTPKKVHFATTRPRWPRGDESCMLKDFTRHVQQCSTCTVTESRDTWQCKLCARGQEYGRNLREYICYHRGNFRSVFEWPDVVVIEDAFRSASIYLQSIARKDRYSKHNEGQHPFTLVQPASVRVEPFIYSSGQMQDDGDLVLHVTVPSFTIPVRLVRRTNTYR